jgi:hypothetical protein
MISMEQKLVGNKIMPFFRGQYAGFVGAKIYNTIISTCTAKILFGNHDPETQFI